MTKAKKGLKTIVCWQCKRFFEAKRYSARYCTKRCKNKFYRTSEIYKPISMG